MNTLIAITTYSQVGNSRTEWLKQVVNMCAGLEVCIFDDGSTDPIHRDYLDTLNCPVFRFENAGSSMNNRRVMEAFGDRNVICLDDDVIFEAGWYNKITEAMAKKPCVYVAEGCSVKGFLLTWTPVLIETIGLLTPLPNLPYGLAHLKWQYAAIKANLATPIDLGYTTCARTANPEMQATCRTQYPNHRLQRPTIPQARKELPPGVRLMHDGTMRLVRSDPKSAEYMDKRFTKLETGIWCTKRKHKSFNELQVTKTTYIVGKGSSICQVPKDCTAICINESIHIVEAQGHNNCIAIQQDAHLRDTCLPERGKMLASTNSQYWYPNAYIFNPIYLGLEPNGLTALCAIRLARLLGADHIILTGFDAITTGDLTYHPDIDRRETVDGSPERFKLHANLILEELAISSYSIK